MLTGAGISLASGIPTFRGSDPGAIWASDILELATYRFFASDPVASWQWYRRRFLGVLSARPNPAHRAVAAIERWQAARGGDFLLVTQNIDTLHEQAGSARLIKVHGSVDRCRCADPSCRMGALDSLPLEQASFDEFDREPCREALPRCPLCGTLLRPHVLWFDEYYTGHADYQWHYVDAAATRMRLLLCVGTSLAVGVTTFLQSSAAASGIPVLLVDPGDRPRDAHRSIVHIRAKAEDLLPQVVESLSAELKLRPTTPDRRS